MGISVSHEAFVFLCSALAGALIFLIYDLFRIIRRRSESGALLIHIQDGTFWLAALAIMFFVIFQVNNGILRFYQLAGAGLGALLYGLTLSPWVLKLFLLAVDFFSKIFKFFLKILLTPLFFAYNILYKVTYFVFRPLKRFVLYMSRRICNSVKQNM